MSPNFSSVLASPFADARRSTRNVDSPSHDEALARLQFLVESHRRLGVLLGPPGVGKSTLLTRFAQQQRETGAAVARVDLLGSSDHEFLWALASRLQAPTHGGESRFAIWRAITDKLLENRAQAVRTVLLFDHVDQANLDVQTLVLRLIHADPSPDIPLTQVLAVERECEWRVDRRLLEQCDLRIDLEAWTERDTEEFIQDRLLKAGRPRDTFDPAAIARLHEVTGGVPRRVRQLADLAFLAGVGQQLPHVDADTIEGVWSELTLASVLATTL